MTALRLPAALAAAAAGGVLGSLARFGVTELFGVTDAFPWTVFWINVVGSAALAGLPALRAVRRAPWLGVFLGTGVLGGFTTMSAASAETVTLLDAGHDLTAWLYVGGTLVAAVTAVAVVDRRVSPALRRAAEAGEVDE